MLLAMVVQVFSNLAVICSCCMMQEMRCLAGIAYCEQGRLTSMLLSLYVGGYNSWKL